MKENDKGVTDWKCSKLKKGVRKIMIINRGALYNRNGEIGYFDYSACLYPYGQLEQNAYFFNEEDIAEVYFVGYSDEDEKKYMAEYQQKIEQIKYPRFSVEE